MTTPGGYSAGTIFLSVVPSFKDFHNAVRKEAKAANKAFESAQNEGRQREAQADKDAATRRGRESGGAYARALSRAIQDATDKLPDLKLKADSSDAQHQIAQIKAELKTLNGTDLSIGANATKAHLAIKRIDAELRELALSSADIDVVVNAAAARADLRQFMRSVEAADGKKVDIHAEFHGDGAERGFKRLMQSAANSGGALRAFNGIVLMLAATLPLLVPAAAAAAAGLMGLGVAAVFALGAVGVLIAGFSGIGDAVGALGDFEDNAAKDTLAAAKTMRNAARQIRDAEQSITRAREQGARAAEDSARRVADAQQRAADVAEQNAKRMRDALRRQRDAEQNLSRAQEDARRAQNRLTEARREAEKQLEDLEMRVRGGALAERQALIDLFEAEVAYRNAMNDGGATNLEREQADINLEQARLRIESIRKENAELAVQQRETAATGVEGSARVVSAQEGVQRANERVAEAQERVSDAAENLRDTQIANARASRDAARAIEDAQRAAARSAVDSAISMRDAQERLTDAQASYREALEQTAEIGSASMRKLEEAMEKLGPAGQAFARFLHSDVLPVLREMRMAIQEGMLPGVTDFLRTLFGTYGPQMVAFLGTMGEVIGGLFREFGTLITTPLWREFFAMVGEMAPIFTQLFGELGMSLMTLFTQLAVAFAPLGTEILGWLIDGAKALSDFLASPEGKDGMERFLGYVRDVGPDVMRFFGQLILALVNLGRALAPYAGVLLTIFTDFLEFIAGMDPKVLGAIAVAIVLITLAMQGVLMVGALYQAVMTAAWVATMPFVGTALVVIGVLAALGLAFFILWNNSETFRDIMTGVARAVAWAFNAFWETLKWIFGAIVSIIKNVLWPVIQTLWDAFLYVTPVGYVLNQAWMHVIKPVFNALVSAVDAIPDAFRNMVEGVQKYWNRFIDHVRTPVKFVIETVFNKGLIAGFNKVAEFFGNDKIPDIPLGPFATPNPTPPNLAGPSTRGGAQAFATGGMVPGFSATPTADNIPAWLTAGEYVLPVNAVNKLRAAYGDQFLEWLRGGGGYATGGLVEFGRLLQGRGFRVAEHPAFGGVRGKHSKNSLHYKGQAIDVNSRPGTSPEEQRELAGIIGLSREYGLRSIFMAPGHYGHAHFDTGGGGSILGNVAGALSSAGGWLKDAAGAVIDKPLNWLRDTVRGLYGDLGDTGIGKFLIGGAEHFIGAAVNKLIGVGAEVGDFFTSDGKDAPPQGYARGGEVKLYDSGGWLQPGLTTVLNASGRPEPVFSAKQWEKIEQGSGLGGGPLIGELHTTTGATPAEIAHELLFATRQIRRGGVYAGRKAP